MFSWGENTRRGFGLDKPKDLDKQNSLDSAVFTRIISQVTHLSAGNQLVAFIRNNGKVAVARMVKEKGKTVTGKLRNVDFNENIHSLSCGNAHVVLLTKAGRVLYLDATSTVPRPVGILEKRKIIQVACGQKHCFALTEDCQLFTWGENGRGQLGLGRGAPSSLTPQPLTSLCGIPLAQISAGGQHSLALSLSGAVFGWGNNQAGQLGLGDTADRHSPAPVRCLSLKKIVFISCGEGHTAALTKGGVVFTFGSGRYGQLGHISLRDEQRPRLVGELWGAKVTQVACGRHHTLVFVRSSNKIYSFGRGEQGQLGNVVRMDQTVPLQVQLPQGTQSVQGIFAGGHHSFSQCSITQPQGEESESDKVSCSRDMMLTLSEDTVDRWVSETDSWNNIQREITKIFSSPACLNGSFLDKSYDKHYKTSEAQSGLDLSHARLAFQKLATKDKVLTKVEEVVLSTLIPSLLPKESLRVEARSVEDVTVEAPLSVEAVRVDVPLSVEAVRVDVPLSVEAVRVDVPLSVEAVRVDVPLSVEAVRVDVPLSVEALRLYLLLPELLRVLVKRKTGANEATLAVADALLHAHTLLDSLWLKLPYSFFRTTVKIFHCLTVRYFNGLLTGDCDPDKNLGITIGVLMKLHKVNGNRRIKMASSNFHIEEIKSLIQGMIDMLPSFLKLNFLYYFEQSCIFDMEAKCLLHKLEYNINLCRHPLLQCFHSQILVCRETLLHDVFKYLQQKVHNFNSPLVVKFQEEDGEDYGGVSLQFYTLLAKELLQPESKVLQVNEHSGLAWFPVDDGSNTEKAYLLGVICGLALYNRCLLNVCFPMALFKKLLGLPPSLDDLKELSPVEARSIQQLLMEDEEVVELLYLDFTYGGQDLIPNGGNVPVTKVNRQKYVDLYVDMVFNKSVGRQFERFRAGFRTGCPLLVWQMFLPEELMTLLHGDNQYEWEELRKNAQYEGYSTTDEIIKNFWTVFTEFSEKEKKDFLTFLTGTDRLPRGRHSKLRLRITRPYTPHADEYYPVAETCFERLKLPNYSSIDVLRHKLLHAITHCDVIGKH
ncbi:probable E3 ubiquitin-protein ligase HERC3 isoform X1 [Osmerus eperlanus]|uniref:probable E3 ubiquitin-protein ligase HERC3 isoform X1 n=1 Tax=Osmerus eperlanus TaxID=29151 RepID=UPI002E12857C